MGAAAGGRTQVTGLVAAAAIAIVLLFLTEPLQYVPIAALGAVLVFAAFSLFDVKALTEIWKIDRLEFGLAMITTLCVVAVGAINGVLIAVALALARFVKQTARPRAEVLGKVDGLPGFHSIERHRSAKTFSGLTLFRFNAPLTFFNADYFKQRALAAADAAAPTCSGLSSTQSQSATSISTACMPCATCARRWRRAAPPSSLRDAGLSFLCGCARPASTERNTSNAFFRLCVRR